MILSRIWHAFFPSPEPSPAAQESIARVETVTVMLKADTEYWRTLAADDAETAARKARR